MAEMKTFDEIDIIMKYRELEIKYQTINLAAYSDHNWILQHSTTLEVLNITVRVAKSALTKFIN